MKRDTSSDLGSQSGNLRNSFYTSTQNCKENQFTSTAQYNPSYLDRLTKLDAFFAGYGSFAVTGTGSNFNRFTLYNTNPPNILFTLTANLTNIVLDTKVSGVSELFINASNSNINGATLLCGCIPEDTGISELTVYDPEGIVLLKYDVELDKLNATVYFNVSLLSLGISGHYALTACMPCSTCIKTNNKACIIFNITQEGVVVIIPNSIIYQNGGFGGGR